MSITYPTLVSECAAITAISSTILVNGDNNFAGIMDAAINYAEGRIYRDLDLPAVSVTDTSVSCSSGIRSISLSTAQGELLAIDTFNIFIPAGATSSNGTRVPVMPISKGVLDAIYPSAASSNCGQPEFFARLSNVQLLFGPTPDQAYGTEVVATTRPNPLSASNSSTWITQNLPELMVAGCMVFLAGYMRDYGSQSDNPQMAQSWESQYQVLLKSALVDSLRMKFESQGWAQEQPSANMPPRT